MGWIILRRNGKIIKKPITLYEITIVQSDRFDGANLTFTHCSAAKGKDAAKREENV